VSGGTGAGPSGPVLDSGGRRVRGLLSRAAELVGAVLLAAMFGAFILQVFMRYVVGRPLEWSLEVCLITYVWFVFWTLALLVREQDHVAFSLFYQSAPVAVRRVLAVVSTLLIAGFFLAALPATFDFISFMAIDSTWVLHLRFDLVFGVFLLFMVAVIWRGLRRLLALFGPDWRAQL
jgi:TRAP-type C4-dicarboxylate transport system permease small subunit